MWEETEREQINMSYVRSGMYHGRIDGGPVCWGGAGEVAVPFSCRVIMGFFDKEVFEQRSEEGGKVQTYGYGGRAL